MEVDTIVCGDCLDVMAEMPDGCVDLVVADSPYYDVLGADWDQQWSSQSDYKNWTHCWMSGCKRLLADGGALYTFGGIGPRNGFVFWNLVEEAAEYLTFVSYINWRRFRGKGYKGLHNNWPDAREDIAYFIKGEKPAVFNKQYMREPGLSTASKKRFQKTGVGLVCTNVWIDIPEAQLDGGLNRTLEHPAQKPGLLIERIIAASSEEDWFIFDPFLGSGTTAVAALKLGRHFYGCDISPEYIELANKQIEKAKLEVAQLSFSVEQKGEWHEP